MRSGDRRAAGSGSRLQPGRGVTQVRTRHTEGWPALSWGTAVRPPASSCGVGMIPPQPARGSVPGPLGSPLSHVCSPHDCGSPPWNGHSRPGTGRRHSPRLRTDAGAGTDLRGHAAGGGSGAPARTAAARACVPTRSPSGRPAGSPALPFHRGVTEQRDHDLRPLGFATAGRAAPVKQKVGDSLETPSSTDESTEKRAAGAGGLTAVAPVAGAQGLSSGRGGRRAWRGRTGPASPQTDRCCSVGLGRPRLVQLHVDKGQLSSSPLEIRRYGTDTLTPEMAEGSQVTSGTNTPVTVLKPECPLGSKPFLWVLFPTPTVHNTGNFPPLPVPSHSLKTWNRPLPQAYLPSPAASPLPTQIV